MDFLQSSVRFVLSILKTTEYTGVPSVTFYVVVLVSSFCGYFIRVSNASGFYLRAIASPVNSSQFRAVPHSCAQSRAIAHSGITIGNPILEG